MNSKEYEVVQIEDEFPLVGKEKIKKKRNYYKAIKIVLRDTLTVLTILATIKNLMN